MPQVFMFILIRLTQHVSGIIMPIIRRTDYINNCILPVTPPPPSLDHTAITDWLPTNTILQLFTHT